VINGDYQDQETLREEGVETAAAFITLADHDEENILMSLFGRSKSSGKVITKINRLDYDDVIRRLDLDTVVYPKNLISDRIIRYVRATANTKGSNIETLYNVIKGKVEATEFVIRNDSRIAGKTIEKLKLKPDVLIGAILRDGVVLIPRGQDTIEVGDSVIVVTKAMSLKSVNDVLE
jgi:trk system potassium uptake protein TrkA